MSWFKAMESNFKIRLNVCKSWSCPNLGIADAVDYVFPVYRLGYKALECVKCGGLPPWFDEQACNHWFSHFMQRNLGATGQGCPGCYSTETIRYGRTRAGKTRLQCRRCKKVFTPQQTTSVNNEKITRILAQLRQGIHRNDTTHYRELSLAALWCEQRLCPSPASVTKMATGTGRIAFQGQKANQLLYIIVSADAITGDILQVTTNYAAWRADETLHYQPSAHLSAPAAQADFKPVLERVKLQEVQFMKRSQFDEINYGSAVLKRNDRGDIVRPVIAIHGHFQRLKRRFACVDEHYLVHECVLRGAAITAWAQEVRAGATHLWFVVEESMPPGTPQGPLNHNGTWRIGWWDNVWQQWGNGASTKMVGLLTGQPGTTIPSLVSVSSCNAFFSWLASQPWWINAASLSANVASQHLVCLAWVYNQSRIKNRANA
ncbi:cytoplasmic protein [Atlantibacter sp.]|uniref:IS1/IS1595 family N-terminal zinc-binding domain-containing protein n=1 Tax=Atlantibacter sp. TaxID=1903473 RepID=UPI0028AADC22|nr:cytoplasmic protein [Atlantibacter sp.]